MPVLPVIALVVTRFVQALRRALADPETRGIAYLFLGTIALGTVVYRAIEGWSWLDALYFSVITLSTVGYGDFSPATSGGKLFTIVYLLLGLGILGSFITVLAAKQAEFRAEQRAARSRPGADRPPDEP